ncbi:MAG: hypothetical protein QOG62_1781 [Thermoleophilaceae bacterium]|nr:hypothetical protein [Thermoleophilaceae bacterium]
MTDVEQLLRSALRPVEPPSNMSERVESRLTDIADAAAEELADWELSAMRDPRNWGRPAAAAVAGAAAGGALFVIQVRRQQKQRNAGRRTALERAARDLAAEARKRLDR